MEWKTMFEHVTLPTITPLQFFVLALLVRATELSGRELRDLLASSGVKSSGPQFYQLMARLEAADQVEGWYAQKEIEHQVVNERRYRATEAGLASWKNACNFYGSLSSQASDPAASHRPSTDRFGDGSRDKDKKGKKTMIAFGSFSSTAASASRYGKKVTKKAAKKAVAHKV